jgi:tRNA pseudouridine38-40 synthase
VQQITGEHRRLAFAGRTDAGVHAFGQVAAFTTDSVMEAHILVRALNALLPHSIAVREAADVSAGFDPRRHAVLRTYRYLIYNARVRSPLWRARAWHVAEPLDIEAMRTAASCLIGEHDFAAFTKAEQKSTVRCVSACDVKVRQPHVEVTIEANAFLRRQVRRTVGALVQVGLGKSTPTVFRETLEAGVPASAGPVAPAYGLYLMSVTYPGLDLGRKMRYHNSSAPLGPTLGEEKQ